MGSQKPPKIIRKINLYLINSHSLPTTLLSNQFLRGLYTPSPIKKGNRGGGDKILKMTHDFLPEILLTKEYQNLIGQEQE